MVACICSHTAHDAESLKTASWSADQNPVSKDGGCEMSTDCGSGDRGGRRTMKGGKQIYKYSGCSRDKSQCAVDKFRLPEQTYRKGNILSVVFITA